MGEGQREMKPLDKEDFKLAAALLYLSMIVFIHSMIVTGLYGKQRLSLCLGT